MLKGFFGVSAVSFALMLGQVTALAGSSDQTKRVGDFAYHVFETYCLELLDNPEIAIVLLGSTAKVELPDKFANAVLYPRIGRAWMFVTNSNKAVVIGISDSGFCTIGSDYDSELVVDNLLKYRSPLETDKTNIGLRNIRTFETRIPGPKRIMDVTIISKWFCNMIRQIWPNYLGPSLTRNSLGSLRAGSNLVSS